MSGSITSSGAITFGAVKGNENVSFSGQVTGNTMSGDYTTGPACGDASGTWSATKL